jgi:hypothetical protein
MRTRNLVVMNTPGFPATPIEVAEVRGRQEAATPRNDEFTFTDYTSS